MPYIFRTTVNRSRNMRAIKASSNATTERRLRAYLIRNGFRGWKVCEKDLPGCPDFFFEHDRVAVFVDGCFWHGCPRCGHTPKTNTPYWIQKLLRNKNRDTKVRRVLRNRGIRTLRFWECTLRDDPAACIKRLIKSLSASERPFIPNQLRKLPLAVPTFI